MDNEFPKRKNTRLKNYDYSDNGAYFVTICTKNRKNILSEVVAVGDDDLGVPKNISNPKWGDDLGAPKKIQLKPFGKIAERYIFSMKTAYRDITVENYIIMPNHIHLLILLNHSDVLDKINGAPRSSPPTISSVIGAFKRFTNQQCNNDLWQRGFYDRIIRNETEFLNAWNYIEYNALKEYAKTPKL